MSSSELLYRSSRKAYPVSGASITSDSDGLLALLSTATTVATVTGAALNGAESTNGALDVGPRLVSLTTAASVGSYNTTDPVVVTGRRGGSPVEYQVWLTDENGGETLVVGVMEFVNSVVFPEQNDTSGGWTMGVSGLYGPTTGRELCRRVKPAAVGTIVCDWGGNGTPGAAIAVQQNATEEIAPFGIVSSTVDLTIYE